MQQAQPVQGQGRGILVVSVCLGGVLGFVLGVVIHVIQNALEQADLNRRRAQGALGRRFERDTLVYTRHTHRVVLRTG
jgi:hypothetical protein